MGRSADGLDAVNTASREDALVEQQVSPSVEICPAGKGIFVRYAASWVSRKSPRRAQHGARHRAHLLQRGSVDAGGAFAVLARADQPPSSPPFAGSPTPGRPARESQCATADPPPWTPPEPAAPSGERRESRPPTHDRPGPPRQHAGGPGAQRLRAGTARSPWNRAHPRRPAWFFSLRHGCDTRSRFTGRRWVPRVGFEPTLDRV